MSTRRCTRVLHLLLLLVVLLLLSPSYAGGERRLLHRHLVQGEPKIEVTTTTMTVAPLDEDGGSDEERKHGRSLRVHTNDYNTNNPSPSMDKPRFKDIPN